MTEGEPKFDAVRAATNVVDTYITKRKNETRSREPIREYFSWESFERNTWAKGTEPDYYEEEQHPSDPRNPDLGDENPFGNDYIPGFWV